MKIYNSKKKKKKKKKKKNNKKAIRSDNGKKKFKTVNFKRSVKKMESNINSPPFRIIPLKMVGAERFNGILISSSAKALLKQSQT